MIGLSQARHAWRQFTTKCGSSFDSRWNSYTAPIVLKIQLEVLRSKGKNYLKYEGKIFSPEKVTSCETSIIFHFGFCENPSKYTKIHQNPMYMGHTKLTQITKSMYLEFQKELGEKKVTRMCRSDVLGSFQVVSMSFINFLKSYRQKTIFFIQNSAPTRRLEGLIPV